MATFLNQDIPNNLVEISPMRPTITELYQDLLVQNTKRNQNVNSSILPWPADMQSASQYVAQNPMVNTRNITLAIPQMKRIKMPAGVKPTQLLDILFNISSVQSAPGQIMFNKSEFEQTIKTLGIFEIIESRTATAKYLSGFTQDTVDINNNFTYNFEIYPQLLGFSVVSPKYSENAFYKNTPNAILSIKRDGMNMLANVLPNAVFNDFLNVINHFYYYDEDNSLYFEQKLLLHFSTSDIEHFNILKKHAELLEHIFAASHLRLLAAGVVNHKPAPFKDNRKLLDGLVSISNIGVQVDCDLRDTSLSVLRSSYSSRTSCIEITI